MKEKLKRLYYGQGKQANRFRLGLLAFDVFTIFSFILSSILQGSPISLALDYVIAILLAIELYARTIIANHPRRFLFKFDSLADILVICSLVITAIFENLAFLRVVRMLRLLRSYHMLNTLREYLPWFKKNEQIIHSTLNLVIFVFVVTAIVYVVEGKQNPHMNNYMDALYFTVATLTTTGFGDITVEDTLGRAIAVMIMVFGVALFLRLVQTIFRPPKVEHPCEQCGLRQHEPDAVHCKHCGNILNIPTDGNWI